MSVEFDKLIPLLVRHHVEFIIIGGFSAALHGSARNTLDLDVVYARGTENLTRLAAALQPYAPYLRGAPPGLPFRLDAETLRNGLNFTLTTSLGNLDLLGEIAGGGNYQMLRPHTNPVEIFDVTCQNLDLPTLIKVKAAAGRPKDFEAIAELKAILEELRARPPA